MRAGIARIHLGCAVVGAAVPVVGSVRFNDGAVFAASNAGATVVAANRAVNGGLAGQ